MKARITTVKQMTEEQITKDQSLTAIQRLELAFQLSQLAAEIQKDPKHNDHPTGINWINLRFNTSSSL